MGAECLIVSTASQTSRELAQAIQNGLVGCGFRDRGVKVQDKNTYVLSHATCPAVTIEAGFVDSEKDNEIFDNHFDSIVFAIAAAICSIAGGAVANENTHISEIEDFIDRLYRKVLNREPDAAGRAGWVNALTRRTVTPKMAAQGICFSSEALGRRAATEEYVKELYRGLLGREPDAIGTQTWLDGLYNNRSRLDVFNAIAESVEFKNIEKKMGF